MAFENNFDIQYLMTNNRLSKPDYNNLCKLICKALFPFRVGSIRRELKFNAVPYELYLNSETITGENQSNPMENDGFGNSLVIIDFETDLIDMIFIPELMDEYFVPNTIPGLPHDKRFLTGERTPDGMLILDSGRYRSLVFTGYEINKYLIDKVKENKALGNISGDIDFSIIFYGSVEEANPTVKIGLTLFISV